MTRLIFSVKTSIEAKIETFRSKVDRPGLTEPTHCIGYVFAYYAWTVLYSYVSRVQLTVISFCVPILMNEMIIRTTFILYEYNMLPACNIINNSLRHGFWIADSKTCRTRLLFADSQYALGQINKLKNYNET